MRIERDSLGTKAVASDAYYGIHAKRACENFPVTTRKVDELLIRNYLKIKAAAAKANFNSHVLEEQKYELISAACHELLFHFDNYRDEYITPALQGGAGTSTNMNVNEVIANKANELAGGQKGTYTFINPNDDVNRCQSTNDTYPTAGHLTMIAKTDQLLTEVRQTSQILLELAERYQGTLKMARTQLEDAIPTTFGKSFHAYYSLLARDIKRLEKARTALLTVPLGGTAVGTGLNADPLYQKSVVSILANLTDLPLKQADDLVDGIQNMDLYVQLADAYKSLAVNLSKVSNDLRLLGSGPQAGLGELNLPKKQAGSSIMPAKVNPVIPEVVTQAAYQVIGYNTTINMAAEAGQLELNAFEPVIFTDLFEGAQLLSGALNTLRKNCLIGLTVNQKHCEQQVSQSASIATALSPRIGYAAASELIKQAIRENVPLPKLLHDQLQMTKEEIDHLYSPARLVGTNKAIRASAKA